MCTGDGLEKGNKQKGKDRIMLQRYMRCVLMSAPIEGTALVRAYLGYI